MTFMLAFLACITNAFMDAIDHGKGARTLRYLWHVLKPMWYILTFMCGMSIVCLYFQFDLINVVSSIIADWWFYILSTVLALWVLWEIVYKAIRYIFKYTGIPEWF